MRMMCIPLILDGPLLIISYTLILWKNLKTMVYLHFSKGGTCDATENQGIPQTSSSDFVRGIAG